MEKIEKNHTVSEIGYHIVFCTKYRKPMLTAEIGIFCKRTLAECCKTYGWLCRSLEVCDDHVHLFIQVEPKFSPSEIVRTLKSVSAIAVFTQFPTLKGNKFWGSGLWSQGFYVGTCGEITERTMRSYIERQNSSQGTSP